jgi:hypothetical protein
MIPRWSIPSGALQRLLGLIRALCSTSVLRQRRKRASRACHLLEEGEARFTSYESRPVTYHVELLAFPIAWYYAERDVPRSWVVAIDSFPITAVPGEGTIT